MQLTFQELRLFSKIFSKDFNINDLTPQLFHELTQDNTTFSFKDIYFLVKYYQTVLDSDYVQQGKDKEKLKVFNQIKTIINLKQNVDTFYAEMTKYGNEKPENFDAVDNDVIKASKYYANKYVGKEKFMDKYTRNNISVLINDVKKTYIHTLQPKHHSSKAKVVYENELNTIKKGNFDFVNKIVKNMVKYENMFNCFAYVRDSNYKNNFLGCHVDDVCFKSNIDKGRKTQTWSILPQKSNLLSQRLNTKQPFVGIFFDMLSGNTDELTKAFPTPVFRNNKFYRYINIPAHNDINEISTEMEEHTKYLSNLLSSKGFKMNNLTTTNNNITKKRVNFFELAMNSWKVMENNEKINIIKQNVAFAYNKTTDSLLDRWYYSEILKQKNLSTGDKKFADDMLYAIDGTIRAKISMLCNTCKALSNFYLSETNLEVKVALESSILAIREFAKTEFKNSDLMYSSKPTAEEKATIAQIRNNFNFLCNDDNFPQGILQRTGQIEKVKENSHKFALQSVATSTTIDYEAKKILLLDRFDNCEKQIKHLGRNSVTKYFNAKEITKLQTQQIELKPAISMLNEIYYPCGLVNIGQHSLVHTLQEKALNNAIVPEYDEAYAKRHDFKAGLQQGVTTQIMDMKNQKAIAKHNAIANENFFIPKIETFTPTTDETNLITQKNLDLELQE